MRKKIFFSLFVSSLMAVILSGCGTPASTSTAQTIKTASGTTSVQTIGANVTTSAVPSVSTYQINQISMSNALVGWAKTTNSLILHTTSGGESWRNVTPYSPGSQILEGVVATSFLNGNIAWAAISGKQQPDGTIPTVLFRTNDGGRTWRKAMLPTSYLGVSQIQFINAKDGWVLSSFGGAAAGSEGVDLFRSTDGGRTWSLVADAGTNPPGALPFFGQKTGMSWISATTGWVTGYSAYNTTYLYRTQDGGVSWHSQSLSSGQTALMTYPPVFFNATDGLLPAPLPNHNGVFFITHDGGKTWSDHRPMPAGAWDFLNIQQGWAVEADNATLEKTSDGGEHWTPITPSTRFGHITQLDFISVREGWAISTPPSGVPMLFRTKDGGHTWMQLSPRRGALAQI